jgi:hypothetical protein
MNRSGIATIAAAGALFVAYAVLRPYSGPAPMEAAHAFAAPAWPIAHLAAVMGFGLLPFGLLGLRTRIEGAWATAAAATTAAGSVLVLPYYGAEAYALHAVGQHVEATGDAASFALVDMIRNGTLQIALFALGLLLVAIGTVLAAVAVWRSGTMPRWAAVPLAAGFLLFLPQFYAPPAMRIAHGVLLAAACAVLAATMRRGGRWAGST